MTPQFGPNKTERKSKTLQVTIPSGDSVSDAIDLREYALGGIIMPSAWTTADLGVKVSEKADGTFVPLKDFSNSYGTTVSIDGAAANAAYMMPTDVFVWPFIKLFSHDGTGAAVNQAADRTFTIVLKT